MSEQAGVVLEQRRAADGRLDVVVLARPERRAEVGERGLARTDVEVHRQVEPGADLPERVPGRVAQVGRARVLRVGGHVDAPVAHVGAALGLTDAGGDVPRRHDRHGQEPVPRLLLHLGHGVVVELDAEQAGSWDP